MLKSPGKFKKIILALFLFSGGMFLGAFLSRSPLQQTLSGNHFKQLPNLLGAKAPLPITDSSAPLRHAFQEGDQSNYLIDVDVLGQGAETGFSSPVNMRFRAVLSVSTERVDRMGNGHLRFLWDDVSMVGDFMETPFEMHYSPERSFVHSAYMNLDTEQGQSLEGIPQMKFFDTPTTAVVSPEGIVLEVHGPKGMDKMLQNNGFIQASAYAEDRENQSPYWESAFQLPLPGIENPVAAKAHNEILEEQFFRGRNCMVIQQDLGAVQTGSRNQAAPLEAGDNTLLNMPSFSIEGRNLIYYDAEESEIIYADLDFFLNMELGQGLKPVQQMYSLMYQVLNELDQGNRAKKEEETTLLDLGVRVQGSLELQERDAFSE